MEHILIGSKRHKDLRHLHLRQRLALKQFEAGNDWKESRFVFVISSVQSQIFQIKCIVQQLLNINSLLLIGSSIFDSKIFSMER